MPFMEECLDWPLSKVLPILQRRIMQGSTYQGIPTLKNPLDFWIYQEILWETRPEIIIEIGNFHGGSALALAHACDNLGAGRVIGIDATHDNIDPRVAAHPRVTLITGDANEMYSIVERQVGENRSVMVIEDSAHTYENTLNVLQTYSPLVGVGKEPAWRRKQQHPETEAPSPMQSKTNPSANESIGRNSRRQPKDRPFGAGQGD